ncbi:MAG: ORF6N domain-containing protein [Bacteroidales bacterium]|nr:ORF6N domain-containing protein [Bacteroidales bacterium]
MGEIVKKDSGRVLISAEEVEEKIVEIRNQRVLLDRDVAVLYGVETREVNQAVRNNPQKFPDGYVLFLTDEETSALRSKNLTLEQATRGRGHHTKYNYKAFTEKGLYMMATILKSQRATSATLAIIETFAKVHNLKRELKELHSESDKEVQKIKMKHFGEVLTDIVMPDMETSETESSLELNFIIGKIKHTVKRVRKGESKQD